jgi:hypothetical protein
MPISVTCECGSHLEIDEKFLGKEIPCPDCQRPLPTSAPPKPPPLDLPENRHTSALAVMSLAVGLVGMFTFVGSLIAVALGLFALRAINRSNKLEGLKLARAGIVVGGIGIFATLVVLITPLGLDAIYRELALEFLGRKSYSDRGVLEGPNNEDYAIKRPSAGRWATFQVQSSNNFQASTTDDLIAVNVSADAFMACQHFPHVLDDDEETTQSKVLARLRKSELVNLLGRLNGKEAPDPIIVAQKKVGDVLEMIVDMRLGGIDRRFLILYKATKNPRMNFFVGCARTSRFERVEEQFREAFTGFRFPPL